MAGLLFYDKKKCFGFEGFLVIFSLFYFNVTVMCWLSSRECTFVVPIINDDSSIFIFFKLKNMFIELMCSM